MNRTGRGGPPKTGEWRPCQTCGQPFYARPCDDRKTHDGRRRYCSNDCRPRSGPANPNWKGGRVPQVSGYVYAHAPSHPHATHDGYVMEHRLVMEAHLGRFLDPVEEVHHVNEVKNDNRLENLELMADAAAHRRRHGDYQADVCAECGTTVLRSAAHRRRWPRAFCGRSCTARFNLRAINGRSAA